MLSIFTVVCIFHGQSEHRRVACSCVSSPECHKGHVEMLWLIPIFWEIQAPSQHSVGQLPLVAFHCCEKDQYLKQFRKTGFVCLVFYYFEKEQYIKQFRKTGFLVLLFCFILFCLHILVSVNYWGKPRQELIQGSSLDAGTKTEIMEKCCLLACGSTF